MSIDKLKLAKTGLRPFAVGALLCCIPLFADKGSSILFYIFLALMIFLLSGRISSADASFLLIPLAVTGLSYFLFAGFAPLIWARNRIADPESLTPWLRQLYEMPRDGIEVYVLYSMVLGILAVSIVFFSIQKKLTNRVRILAYAASSLVSVVFLLSVKWYIPMSAVFRVEKYIVALLAAVSAIWLVLFMAEKNFRRLRLFILPILLLPVCFISFANNVSMYDYSFILDPALRIMSGVPVSEVYLQYDLLLSLVSIPFLSLKVNFVYLQVLAQLSLYILFVGILLYARKWVRHPNVLIGMMLTLIIVKIYGNLGEPTECLQVTPLRLDWWLLPVILIFSFGMTHWTIGLSLGFLLIFHNTFGIIYTLAYAQGILVFFLLGVKDNLASAKISEAIKASALEAFRKTWKNAAILIACFALSALLYKRAGLSDAARLYQGLGIGFDRISGVSFYWYVPVLLGTAALLLIGKRKVLDDRYFTNGVFLILFAVGNSIYFFGRSHENNIINISAILIVVLFLTLDLIVLSASSPADGNGAVRRGALFVLPLVITLSAAYGYSDSVLRRALGQFGRLSHLSIYNPHAYDFDIEPIKKATKNSAKIFVLSENVHRPDFYIYYYGGYVPPAYFSPYYAWADKTALIDYSQKLLDEGYYLICENPKDEIAARLSYASLESAGDYSVLSK